LDKDGSECDGRRGECNPPFIGTSRSDCTNTSMAKKLRYMSKIAAILATTDNTQLSCTQPIANLLTAFL
jgi:hypothetical protein